jgi:zinc protease
VLPRVLQVEEARSLYASASYSGTNLDDTAFSIFNVPVPGVSLEEAEADLDRVIAQFLEDGIDPEQFARIQFQWEAEMIYAQDDVGDLARMYGVGLTSGLTVQDIQDWPDVIASITPEEVMDAARMIFTETTSVTGYLTAPGL